MLRKLDPNIYAKVRLHASVLDVLVLAFQKNFGPNDHLWIFGSRVNLQARGGDIDLYVETPETDANLISQRESKFVISTWKEIGEQRIDVVINMTSSKLQLPIYAIALKNGVQLI